MTLPTSTAAAAAPRHSLIRNLIPFTIAGAGPVANLYRAAFLHRQPLVKNMLKRLETLDTALHPRVALAEALQRMLQGQLLQRDLRPLFERAEVMYRRELNDTNCRCSTDPPYRLLTLQLWLTSIFYVDMLAVSADPFHNAEIRLYSGMTSDVGKDELLTKLFVAYENFETRPEIPPEFIECIEEMLLLERDLFGKYRFDSRRGVKALTHAIALDAVGHDATTASLLDHETIQKYGNFLTEVKEINNGRWREHRLWCGEEDHRLFDFLPGKEKITVAGEGWSHDIVLSYDTPLCTRTHEVDPTLLKSGEAYVEKFEVVIPKHRSWLARTFLDR